MQKINEIEIVQIIYFECLIRSDFITAAINTEYTDS